MVGCWFTGQGKKWDCVGKKVNDGPVDPSSLPSALGGAALGGSSRLDCMHLLRIKYDIRLLMPICIKCKASRLQLLWPCGNSLLVVEDMETMVNMVSESDHFCMDHVQCSH